MPKHSMIVVSAAAFLVSSAALVLAQTPPDQTSPADAPTVTRDLDRDDDFDWGWLEECRLFIAFSTHAGTGVPVTILNDIFPGHQYKAWMPILKLSDKQLKVAQAIERARSDRLTKDELTKRTGVRNMNQLNQLLRHKNVVEYLKERVT